MLWKASSNVLVVDFNSHTTARDMMKQGGNNMSAPIKAGLYFLLAAALLFGFITQQQYASTTTQDLKSWTEKFDVSGCVWSSTGRNDFFILEPGYQQILEGKEDNEQTRLEITVLDEIRRIGNIETRVVEERESENGELAEISRNYFAVCTPANDIFYFGEEVDLYEGGKVSGHEGAWIAETNGAKAGLFMPFRPLLGARFYQEVAPKVAMDRVEIQSDNDSLKTPAGDFQDCLKTEETTPLEPGVKEYKVYAKKVGIIQDGSLLLTKYGHVSSKK
jgi:hypothetical protein